MCTDLWISFVGDMILCVLTLEPIFSLIMWAWRKLFHSWITLALVKPARQAHTSAVTPLIEPKPCSDQ